MVLVRIGSERVHLVGVGGAGMSALARLFHGIGGDLTGSDRAANAVVTALQAEGVRVWGGQHPERIEGEDGYVVRSAAVPLSDPEVEECERRGFTSLLYAETVGRLSEGKRTFAVGGTHGKTTTTGLTVAALRGAGLDPSHLIGGEIPELGGNGYGGRDDLLVVEACEFNRSFHQLRPYGAAILNLDHDHFDCYPSTEDLIEAFAGYAARVRSGGTLFVEETVPDLVVQTISDDVRVIRVGSGLFAELRAVDMEDDLGRYSFTPMMLGERLPRVTLSVAGRFQVMNALFAIGMVMMTDGDIEGACEGLSEFAGIRRRFEMHEGPKGGLLVNDYAHHPEELRVVLRAARKRFPGRRVFAVFQPHQHRRTLHLFDGFAEVLATTDHCLIPEIYGAREDEEIRAAVSAEGLAGAVSARGASCEGGMAVVDTAQRVLEQYQDGDLVMVLGAGDIDQIVDQIVPAI